MLFGESKRDRYATLFGDRIHAPLAAAFMMAADSKIAAAAGLAAGGAALLAGMAEPATLMMAGAGAGFGLLGAAEARLLERFVVSTWYPGARSGKKCIDMKPSAAQAVRSVAENGHASDLVRREMPFLSPFIIVSAAMAAATLTEHNTALMAAACLSNLAGLLCRIGGTVIRHNNIVSGKWAVTETPSPEEVKDEARGSVFSPQPRPVPVPIPVRRR